MQVRRFIGLFLVVAITGFATVRSRAQVIASVGGDSVPTSKSETRSVGSKMDSSQVVSSQFILGPADVVRVNVWKNADLSQTVTVGPDGFVSLPLLGDVHVAGLTSDQLAKDLAERLGTYVVSPQVTVSVVDIRSRQVYIMGQVAKPGGYSLVAPISVLQLIAQAGGLTTYANRKGILILRASSGSTERLRFNYVNAINGDDKQNINLQPGDTVVVR